MFNIISGHNALLKSDRKFPFFLNSTIESFAKVYGIENLLCPHIRIRERRKIKILIASCPLMR